MMFSNTIEKLCQAYIVLKSTISVATVEGVNSKANYDNLQQNNSKSSYTEITKMFVIG